MNSYAPTLSKRSGLGADHGDTIDTSNAPVSNPTQDHPSRNLISESDIYDRIIEPITKK
jgi:hypothetical protein